MKTAENTQTDYTTTDSLKLVDKVILFAFNYDYYFIENAFIDDQRMAKHFREKFSNFYERFGNGENAFLWLYTNMTSHNKATLVNYINKTFKG